MRAHISVTGAPRTIPAPRSRTRRALVGLVAVALLASGCGRGDPGSSDEPVNEPGEPIEVAGRAGLVFHDVSPAGTLVFPVTSSNDQPIPADADALSAAATRITAWLDTVLTERNLGETTTVGRSDVDAREIAVALGIDGTPAGELPALQVVRATYLIELAHLGTPGWAIARVESQLVGLDAPDVEVSRRLDTFVFSIDASGALEFLALEVGP